MGGMTVVWLSAAVAAIVAAATAADTAVLSLAQFSPQAVGGVLSGLVFIALLIERAVEVFVSPLSGEDKQEQVTLQAQVRGQMAEARRGMEAAKQAQLRDPSAQAATDQLSQSQIRLETLAEQERQALSTIATLDARTQRLALSISVPVALLVSLSGVRAMGGLVSVPPGSLSGALFAAADVVLTAGLLAGGADGIHKILDRLIKRAAGQDVRQPATKP